jgi:hypothetical protein
LADLAVVWDEGAAPPLCPLYGMEPKDAKHLLINCVFTREIYWLIWLWFGMRGSVCTCPPSQEPADWLECNAATANTGDGRKVAGILLYCWWNITPLLLVEHVERA